jgi:hypothetical protein
MLFIHGAPNRGKGCKIALTISCFYIFLTSTIKIMRDRLRFRGEIIKPKIKSFLKTNMLINRMYSYLIVSLAIEKLVKIPYPFFTFPNTNTGSEKGLSLLSLKFSRLRLYLK